jgi:hypothetical protein
LNSLKYLAFLIFMTLTVFANSLSVSHPAHDLNLYLKALWYDAKGDWNKAHELIQDEETKEAAWIHAYLHRKEGDLANATYWYHRAGKPVYKKSLEEEWKEIVTAFL